MTKIVRLIYTEQRTGDGQKDNPSRLAKQLWTEDGRLVLSYDPYTREATVGEESLCNDM